jgi:GT2 family glycosyltransferase
MGDAPPLSVVLATLGRPGPCAAVLRQVLAQLPPGGEVLVVDQSGPLQAEDLRAVVASDPRARWCPSAPPSLPRARNVGLAAARGAIVLFLDDDVVLHPGCLAAHLGAYDDPTVGGVAGRIVERRLRPNARRLRNDVGWDGRIRTRLDHPADGWVGTAKGANMSFRRAALAQVGGFDLGFAGTSLLEDADASARVVGAGWRIRFVAAAAVDHEHLSTGGVRRPPAEALRWRFHNTARYLRRHRGLPGLLLATPTFAALAGRAAVAERRAGPAIDLARAWVRGAVSR